MRAILLIAAACVIGLADGAAQSENVRHARSTGAPIAAQVRQTDERLILESADPPPMVLVGEYGKHLDTMTDIAHGILVIHVEPVKRSELNERGSWIRSRVTARVERILKPSPRLALREESFVSFYENGGTLRVGRTLVEAVVPWARTFQPGKRYLIFCAVSPDGELIVGPNASYEEVDRGRARRVMRWPSENDFDEIEAMGIDAAAAAILARSRSH